jgi:hypothetical protein
VGEASDIGDFWVKARFLYPMLLPYEWIVVDFWGRAIL